MSLEDVVRALIEHCRARCGSGFGNYPMGVRYAIGELLPLVNLDTTGRDGRTIAEKVKDLDDRLAR